MVQTKHIFTTVYTVGGLIYSNAPLSIEEQKKLFVVLWQHILTLIQEAVYLAHRAEEFPQLPYWTT